MANAVESIIDDLEQLGVYVAESFTQNSVCMSLADGKITCFNPSLLSTTVERHTALMHECGHFLSGAFYLPYSDYVIAEQAEYRANKAAILTYIPEAEISACALDGVTELWELADHFSVTEEFMLWALLYYQERRYADL